MTEFWRMGATPVPVSEIGRFAREFEASGWDGFAVGEAHGLLPDPYPTLAVAAAATTTLKVGTAVAVPLRHPLLAAGAMATLQGLSHGRARFCLGRGDGAMKVLRKKPMKVAEFEQYLARLQGFLRRVNVDLEDVPVSMARLDDIDPSLGAERPRVDVAATGPKTIETAARLADGISFSVGADSDRLSNAIRSAQDVCEAAGRDPDTLDFGCFVQVALTDESDDTAREAIRGLVVTHARFSGFEATATADVAEAQHDQYRNAVAVMEDIYHAERGGVTRTPGGAPGEIDFYPREAGPDDLIDQFGIAGSPEYCAARLREIMELGIARIYIGTRAVGVDLAERNAERIGREVLPLLR
jgi:5,10-methylenetetrahydromethanopterin reductase